MSQQLLPDEMISTAYYHSPVGWMKMQASEEGVVSLRFCDGYPHADLHVQDTLAGYIVQLDEYFAGQRLTFDIPVCQRGTAFQQKVWHTLMDIPYGVTISYAGVAGMMHRPQSARAVGAANGRNQVWIVVPCHRVIGSDGALTGYAGGIGRKRWLLSHEARVLRQSARDKGNGASVQLNLFSSLI